MVKWMLQGYNMPPWHLCSHVGSTWLLYSLKKIKINKVVVLERKLKKRRRKTIFSLLWQIEVSHAPTTTGKGGQTFMELGHGAAPIHHRGIHPERERDTNEKQSWSSAAPQHTAARATTLTTDLGEGHSLMSDLQWFC